MEIKERIKLRGILKFPQKDENNFTSKFIVLNEDDLELINSIEDESGLELKKKGIIHDDIEYLSFNVRTSFEFPIFDLAGNKKESDYILYDGSDVICIMEIKNYEYHEKGSRFTKKGLCAYIQGMVVIKEGTPIQNGITFDDFEIDDDIQY